MYLIDESINNGEKGSLSEDETKVLDLLCESVAGMLNAFLLPIYTLKQGEGILDYFALPVTKIILEWIVLNPKILEENAFVKRMQIWPSFCKMLNELMHFTSFDENDDLKRLESYPLPEDYDLQVMIIFIKI